MKINKYILLLLTVIQLNLVKSQQKTAKTAIFDKNIHSLQVYRPDWEFTYPVIELNSGEILEIHFDDLSKNVRDFSYTLEFCNADWTLSDLMKSDYIDGFDEQPLTDYQFSSNTTMPYVHYQLNLPNDNVKFLLPGNYLLKIYKDNDKDSLILTQQIYVLEKLLDVSATIIRPIEASLNSTHQQVNVVVDDVDAYVRDPYNDLVIKISQNNRSDRVHTFSSPKYVRANTYEYRDEKKNIFSGGSEFFHFDTKNIRFKEMQTDSIVYDGHFYHFYIRKEELKPWRTYLHFSDINGRYKVQLENSDKSAILADYVYVHLNLQADKYTFGQNFYAIGDFNFWSKNESSRFVWQKKANAFSKTFFLKQGYYDYSIENENFNKNPNAIENHTETENDYLIWVYLKDKTLYFDKLVGFFVANSQTMSQ